MLGYCREETSYFYRKQEDAIYRPELNKFLSDKFIIDVCCGAHHSLALTKNGEVYTCGKNKNEQIGSGKFNFCESRPLKVNGFDDEKIVMISCGERHSMALTETVFSWGSNECGQLGRNFTEDINKPHVVLLSNKIPIEKTSCV